MYTSRVPLLSNRVEIAFCSPMLIRWEDGNVYEGYMGRLSNVIFPIVNVMCFLVMNSLGKVHGIPYVRRVGMRDINLYEDNVERLIELCV